jgi:hypothetical protein
MQVRPAYGACLDTHPDFAGAWEWFGPMLEYEWLTDRQQRHRSHAASRVLDRRTTRVMDGATVAT